MLAAARRPTYLRVVLTTACTLDCTYCHGEGLDRAAHRGERLSAAEVAELVLAGAEQGVRKVKFLGGEPLLRRDLPEILRRVRAGGPDLDLSIITGATVDPAQLDAAFAAGLDRANLTIHGWTLEAFTARTRRDRAAWELRRRFVARLLAHGRPAKLNTVWRGPEDDADLAALLDEVARWPVVVGLLDDLGRDGLGPEALVGTLIRLRGLPASVGTDADPHSLDTLRLRWADGLEVEIKHRHLGALAPWRACAACPVRDRCREGIFAVRLDAAGVLRPCMDRPDLGLPLLPVLRAGGRAAAARAWGAWLGRALACPVPAAPRVPSGESPLEVR